ncbi:MAG: alanine racemase [Solirubrobacterales bacterium]|nr:alanine racemase [Solirubrobacterales bacterium]
MLRAEARVNLAAIERNCRRLARELAPGVALGAVVKAGGYGHGAAPAARAALAGGASWLCVATAAEAAELRGASIAARILVMGALSPEELDDALEARADLVAWDERFVAEVAARSRRPVGIHVKLDTGMGRLGTREVAVADAVAAAVTRSPGLVLAGAMTHTATSDDDPEFMAAQLERFRAWAGPLGEQHRDLVVHAANSGATLRGADAHFDMVRCGIAIYGLDPFHEDAAARRLEPALELTSYVAAVKPIAPGESVGYGRRFVAREPGWIATLPIGYGDGVRRAFTNDLDVLIGGRRVPLVGTVSMDNVTVLLDGRGVEVGERATLIGVQDGEHVAAEELARRIGTINYEIVCGLSARVPRTYHRDGTPV